MHIFNLRDIFGTNITRDWTQLKYQRLMTQGIYSISFDLSFFLIITGVCSEIMAIGKVFEAITGVCSKTWTLQSLGSAPGLEPCKHLGSLAVHCRHPLHCLGAVLQQLGHYNNWWQIFSQNTPILGTLANPNLLAKGFHHGRDASNWDLRLESFEATSSGLLQALRSEACAGKVSETWNSVGIKVKRANSRIF